MTIAKYLINCLVAFLDVWSGADYSARWLPGFILIAVTVAMYFFIYWNVISPKCYKMWLCSLCTFCVCVAIWCVLIFLCISVEYILKLIL